MSEPESWLDPEYIERLKQEIRDDPELSLAVQISQRVGAPVTEVLARWSGWDMALEVAYASIRTEEHIRTCPNCGIDPETMHDASGRRLGTGFAYRLQIDDCSFCAERDELAARLAHEEYRPKPPSLRYVPRLKGEPFAPDQAEFSLGEPPPPEE